MQTKLTLSIEAGTIERAKRYARGHRKSVSQIVEDYFRSLTAEEVDRKKAIPPITRELAGSLKGAQVADLKKERADYLSTKFLR